MLEKYNKVYEQSVEPDRLNREDYPSSTRPKEIPSDEELKRFKVRVETIFEFGDKMKISIYTPYGSYFLGIHLPDNIDDGGNYNGYYAYYNNDSPTPRKYIAAYDGLRNVMINKYIGRSEIIEDECYLNLNSQNKITFIVDYNERYFNEVYFNIIALKQYDYSTKFREIINATYPMYYMFVPKVEYVPIVSDSVYDDIVSPWLDLKDNMVD